MTAPQYIYDGRIIGKKIAELKCALPEFGILYSIKANPYLPLLSYIASQQVGADAAAKNEVLLAAGAGVPAENIYYSGPGKTAADLEETFDKCVIIADSFHELELLNRIARERRRKKSVGIRINPSFWGTPGKFGIDEELCTVAALSCYPHLVIAGIHVHVKSQELDWQKIYRYYENVFSLAEKIQNELGEKLSFINFGSGIGVPYTADDKPVDLAKLSTACGLLVKKYQSKIPAKLLIESGRFIVCEAGTYTTEVLDIKKSRGRTYLVVAGGLNGFARPAVAALLEKDHQATEPLFTKHHAWTISLDKKSDEMEMVDIVGNLCTASDILAKDLLLPKAEIGDRITITNAGSYACTLSFQQFGGQDAPVETLVFTDEDSH
ncbi:L-glutamyl-[BtrI acyl-carrier protein] decarboxylase [Methanocorpusculaceae archaeon Sp1]|nr:L-glutamyl-[BtrI acyl-carrier protein] decarboxylase [Methanocorpusculaceae archaeon Sp1]